MEKIHTNIPSIEEDFKPICDSDLSTIEIKNAFFSMTKGKAPGINGLSVEFCIHLTVTMKQGVIPLIPKPDKDLLTIEN